MFVVYMSLLWGGRIGWCWLITYSCITFMWCMVNDVRVVRQPDFIDQCFGELDLHKDIIVHHTRKTVIIGEAFKSYR